VNKAVLELPLGTRRKYALMLWEKCFGEEERGLAEKLVSLHEHIDEERSTTALRPRLWLWRKKRELRKVQKRKTTLLALRGAIASRKFEAALHILELELYDMRVMGIPNGKLLGYTLNLREVIRSLNDEIAASSAVS